MSTHGNSAGHEPADACGQNDVNQVVAIDTLKLATDQVIYFAQKAKDENCECTETLRHLKTAAKWLTHEVALEERKRASQGVHEEAARAADAEGQSQADVK